MRLRRTLVISSAAILSLVTGLNGVHAAESGAPPEKFIRPGYYVKMYSSWKLGGSSRHELLATSLRKRQELRGYRIQCLNDLNQYNSADRHSAVIENCAGSSYILVGPFPGATEAQAIIRKAELDSVELYVYVEAVRCDTTCNPLPAQTN